MIFPFHSANDWLCCTVQCLHRTAGKWCRLIGYNVFIVSCKKNYHARLSSPWHRELVYVVTTDMEIMCVDITQELLIAIFINLAFYDGRFFITGWKGITFIIVRPCKNALPFCCTSWKHNNLSTIVIQWWPFLCHSLHLFPFMCACGYYLTPSL